MTGLTAKQMVYEAKIFYEDIASNNAPSFTDREWSVILTNAQNQVVQEIYNTGYDDKEENRLGIQSLLTPYTQKEFKTGDLANSYVLELPETMMYMSYEQCELKNSENALVVPISYDAYHSNLANPFKTPSRLKVWRVVGYDGKNLIVSKYPVTMYRGIYVMRPYPIIVSDLAEDKALEIREGVPIFRQADCKLHSVTHRKIVQTAARIAYASTQEQVGYQIQDIETKRN